MKVLGIETSCDETSAAVVSDGTIVLSNIIASSAKDHSPFGGVVPELAARKQLECIIPVIRNALSDAELEWNQLDAIAVTKGPGLLTSLLVGTTTSRVLSSVFRLPLIGVHHTFGHISSPWLECDEEIHFPLLTLSVSGGHTELWFRESHTRHTLLGRTRDDAAGEAFDKGASLFDLPYPGGPALSQLASGGNPHFVPFPHPLRGEDTCDFSFSGLKTSLKYVLRDRGGLAALSVVERKDIAAGYEQAICNHLLTRVGHAVDTHQTIKEIHVVGGVSANSTLRTLVQDFARARDVTLRLPKKMSYCTDNAAMIAAAGYFLHTEQLSLAAGRFQTDASVSL